MGFFVGLFIVLHSVRNSYEHARNVVLRGIKSISGLLLVTSMIIILGPLSLRTFIITLGPIKIGGIILSILALGLISVPFYRVFKNQNTGDS